MAVPKKPAPGIAPIVDGRRQDAFCGGEPGPATDGNATAFQSARPPRTHQPLRIPALV